MIHGVGRVKMEVAYSPGVPVDLRLGDREPDPCYRGGLLRMEALEDQEDPVIALGRDPIQISLTENSQKPFVLRAPTWVRSGWSSGRDMIALLIRFEKSCAS